MPVGWGFDYGTFDEARFDGVSDEAAFALEVKKTFSQPYLRFYFDGTLYDSRILAAPQLSRSANAGVGFASITLTNIDQTWNIFISNKDNMGKVCEIVLYFPAIVASAKLYEGTVEDVDFPRAKVTLKLRDKISPMLEIELGDGENEWPYYSSAWNPADMVWDILTDVNGGALDSTTSDANEDIDYTSWTNWKTDCTNELYLLRARFTGESIQHVLRRITELTNSVVWVDAEGRFKFDMFIAPFSGTETLTVSNCLDIDVRIRKDRIINRVECYNGYDAVNDVWPDIGSPVIDYDLTSQGVFGLRLEVEQDRTIWHSTVSSATAYAAAILSKFKDPEEFVLIHSTMIGFLLDIADRIYVTEPLKGLSSREYWIEELTSVNLEDGTVQFIGRKI